MIASTFLSSSRVDLLLMVGCSEIERLFLKERWHWICIWSWTHGSYDRNLNCWLKGMGTSLIRLSRIQCICMVFLLKTHTDLVPCLTAMSGPLQDSFFNKWPGLHRIFMDKLIVTYRTTLGSHLLQISLSTFFKMI